MTSLLLALVGWVSPAGAQDVPGRVLVHVHDETGPVGGAEVLSGAERAVTNDEGEARLTLPAGENRLEVRRIGYGPAETRVHVVAGEEVVVRIDLRSEAIEVEGVTVLSTRTGRRLRDEPLRVEVLDREVIEEKMLMRPGNIVMLLNETGGLRVQVTSPSLGAASIRVQGMRGRYTQLLADGLPLYGGQAGAIGLMQIPPVDLGQVEVIKGVASALYGASALGGVVNLISLRPEEETSGELILNATSRDGQDVTAYVSGPLTDSWGYSLLGGMHRQGIQDLDGSGWADMPAHRRLTLRPRLFWSGPDGASALLTVGGMTEEREGGTLPGRTLSEGGSFEESLDTDRLDAGLSVRYPLGDSRSLQVRASGMTQRHRHRFGDVVEHDRHGTLFGEAAVSGSAGIHTWVLGAAVQQDRYRSRTLPAFDYTFTVPAVFGQSEVRFTPDFTASASARWDGHSEYGSHLSPRISLLYRPSPWTFRASVGGGFFAPTPFTEETEATGLRRLEPLAGLRSERALTAALDAGRTFGPLEVNGTLFASRVEDAVELVPVDDGEAAEDGRVRLVNAGGDTRTAGAEFLLRYRWDAISVTGSWVALRATEPGPDESARRDVPLTPRHTAGLVAMWEDHERGILGVETYFTGGQSLEDNPYRTRGKAHVHVGVLGELRREGWSVFLNAENLLNVRQTRHDPLVRDVRAPDGRWTVNAWAPLEGMIVNGGVRIAL